METLESKLDELLVKKAPVQIPEAGRKAIVEWSPWINLVFGVLGLIASWYLWEGAHRVNRLIDVVNNSIYAEVGGTAVTKLGVFFWISLLALIASSVIMLAAVPGLRERSKKKGWNLAFYGVLLNFAYGLVYLFSNQVSAFANFIWAIVTTTFGLYVLFQIRSYFNGSRAKAKK